MKHSLFEIVDVLVQRIQEHPEAAPSEKGIRTWLARQGYSKREIEAALKLVRPRVRAVAPEFLDGPSTVRMPSVFEEFKLSKEARNAFSRMELYGLLEPHEREMVLDYLNHFEGEVGIQELDYLLSWLICGSRDVGFQQTLYHAFEGKTETLH